jgi:hypothetical protein
VKDPFTDMVRLVETLRFVKGRQRFKKSFSNAEIGDPLSARAPRVPSLDQDARVESYGHQEAYDKAMSM